MAKRTSPFGGGRPGRSAGAQVTQADLAGSNTPNAHRLASRSANRLVTGSAAVEFVVMIPFILAIMALVWDLREYIAYRTELAREMFAITELIANELAADPIETIVGRAMARFSENSAGTIAVAVVTRGTLRGVGESCEADGWCRPLVSAQWPPVPEAGSWDEGGDCAGLASRLPAVGEHFTADQPVLPNEVPADADPAPAEPDWISRNMRPREWWVVADTCFHPKPGLFFGRLGNLGMGLFDVQGFILHKRAAWGSPHDKADCAWCEVSVP